MSGGIVLNELGFNILDLLELQFLENIMDRKVNETKALAENKKLVLLKEKLEKINSDLNSLNKSYDDLKHKQKKMEDSVATQSGKIKKNEEMLFSGTITSSKELVNYQDEIKILKASSDEIENKILEIMIVIDDKIKEVKEVEDKKKEIEIQITELKENIKARIKVIKDSLKGLEKKRKIVISKIPKEYIEKYKILKNKKGGIAIGVLKDGFCDVCNMKIPSMETEKMKDLDKLYKCSLCGRMLIVDRDEVDIIKAQIDS